MKRSPLKSATSLQRSPENACISAIMGPPQKRPGGAMNAPGPAQEVQAPMHDAPYGRAGRERACPQCGETFIARKEHRNFTRKYCTTECYIKAQRQRSVALVCEECGSHFKVSRSRAAAGRKYCSRACWTKNSRLSDEQYRRNGERMHTERRGTGNPRFKHGRDGNRAWRSRFNLALKGEDCCRVCGSTSGLQLHHAIPRSASRAARDELLNGLPVCVQCHMRWHRGWRGIYRDVFTAEEWAYLSALELTGQRIEAWLDDHYPERPAEASA